EPARAHGLWAHARALAPHARSSLHHRGEDASRALPRLRLRQRDDRAQRHADAWAAPEGGGLLVDVGDTLLDGGERLAPERVHVAVLGRYRGRRARGAPEVERDPARLERLDLRERLGEPIELALVIERLGRRPHAA